MLQIFLGKSFHVTLHFCGIFMRHPMTIHRNDDKVNQAFHRKCFPIRSRKSSIFCLTFSYFAILHHNCNLFNTSKPAMLDGSLPTQVFPRSDPPRSTRRIWVSTPAKLWDRPHQPAVFIIVQGCTPVPVRPFPWIFGGILTTRLLQAFPLQLKNLGRWRFFGPIFKVPSSPPSVWLPKIRQVYGK